MRISKKAANLVGSEIIRLGNEINDRIRQGEKIHNLTIGDFDPSIFPIPAELRDEILSAYAAGHTNYPAANGIPELRKAVSTFLKERQDLDYSADEILIAGGARPLIYAAYQAVVDPGDKVIFPVPSWNNNHYTHLSDGVKIQLEATAENNFMPTADQIIPHLKDAALVAVCSPLNPTGTVFSREQLQTICDAILAENKRRGPDAKPVYLMYDQIYWTLTFGETRHWNPIELCPELRPYVIFIDGLSKAFAATGVRVGWAFGPKDIMDQMKSLLGHVGAWAPKAEQVASARYLNQRENVDAYLTQIKADLLDRLNAFYEGFQELKAAGYAVDAISPQAAIYLTVRFDLAGLRTPEGKVLENTRDVAAYLLAAAKVAIVPFYAFGADETSSWFRLSVGTAHMNQIPEMFATLRAALAALQPVTV